MRWLTPLHIQIISNKKRNVQRQYYYHIAIIFYISKPPMRWLTHLCTPIYYAIWGFLSISNLALQSLCTQAENNFFFAINGTTPHF